MIDDLERRTALHDSDADEWHTRLTRALMSGERVSIMDQVSYAPHAGDGLSVDADSLPTLDAAVLRNFLTTFVEQHDPRGLMIRGVRILGELDLEHLAVDFPIAFEYVYMDRALNLQGLKAPQLDLYKSRFQSVQLEHATIDKSLIIQDCSIENQLDLSSVSCGELCLDRTKILAREPSDWAALKAQGITVHGPANAYEIECHGEINFVGAKIGAHLALVGAKSLTRCESILVPSTLEKEVEYKHLCNHSAICMDSAEIGGMLELQNIDSGCSVRLRGVKIGGQLNLSNSRIGRFDPAEFKKYKSGPSCQLDLTGAQIGHAAVLRGLVAGNIRLQDATMKDLELDNGVIGCCGDKSIEASGASIASVSLTGSRLMGIADFQQSKINGSIKAISSHQMTVLDGLNVSRAEIGGGIDLGNTQVTKTGISAEHAKISGLVIIHLNSTIAAAQSMAHVIRAANSCMHSFQVSASTDLGGALNFDGATITHVQIGGKSSKENEFASSGSSSVIAENQMTAMYARNANVLHLQIHNDSLWRGELVLSGSDIGHLNIEPGSSEAPFVTGTSAFTLTTASGQPFTDWKTSRTWLEGGPVASSSLDQGFRSQPWLEVAKVFESVGQETDGRRLRYEAADRLLRTRKSWFSNTAWRQISRLTIGHGFYSQAAIAWLALLWALSTLLIGLNPAAFTPTDRSAAFFSSESVTDSVDVPTDGEIDASTSMNLSESEVTTALTTPAPLAYPSLIAPLYAIDVVLPPLGTGQSTAWQVSSDAWLSVSLTIIKMMSWALLGLFITGVSGLLGKK